MSTPISSSDTGAFVEAFVVGVTDIDTGASSDGEGFKVLASDSGTFAESSNAFSDLADNQFLIAPANGSTTQTLYPVFTVIEKLIDKSRLPPAILQLQIDTAPSFSVSPHYIQFSTLIVDGSSPTSVLLSTPLTLGTTYYWRVRSVAWTSLSPWTSVFSFTAGASVTTTVITGTWTCTTGNPAQPQLWGVTPGRGKVGDSVTAYGIGFGDSQGISTVKIAGATATATSWSTISALSDAYTSARKIDLKAGYYSPEHQKVAVTVPTASSPGGPFVVEVAGSPVWTDFTSHYGTTPDFTVTGPVTIPVPVSAANHDLEVNFDVSGGGSFTLFTNNYMTANGFTPSSPYTLPSGHTAAVRLSDYGPFDGFGNDIGPNTGAFSADPTDPMTYLSLIV